MKATLILVCTALLMACGPSKQSQSAGTKRYKLTGRVVSVDKQSKSVTVEGDDIPGFMSAMTMPYQVKNASDLDRVAPGDSIAAEIVGRDTEYWLENIQITKHSNAPPGAH
jgi:protein SCO1/2